MPTARARPEPAFPVNSPDRTFSQRSFLLKRYWGPVYLVLAAGAILQFFHKWVYDDPFIAYRYAANLAEGNGFVYNPGEVVLSTTTILLVMLLAALHPISGNLPFWAHVLSAFSLAAVPLALWSLARAWRTPAVGWMGLLLVPAFPLLLSTLGSEIPLVLALATCSMAAYAGRRYYWAAVLSGLAVLARPDAALVPLILSTHFVFVNRSRLRADFPWRTMAGAAALFLLVTLPWVVFAWLTFGSPIPETLGVKVMQGHMSVSTRYFAGIFWLAGQYARHPFFWALVGLCILGAIYLVRQPRYRSWLLFLAWPLLHVMAYSLLGVSRYVWYYAPLVLGVLVLSGVGLDGLALWLHHRRPKIPTGAAAAGISLVLFIGMLPMVWGQQKWLDPRVALYQDIAAWLANNTPMDARVGVLESGVIGYYSGRRMVDFSGLLQPGVAEHLVAGGYDGAAQWAIEQYRPRYLVLQQGMFPGLESGYVARSCRPVKEYPAGSYGYRLPVLIYDCLFRQ